MTETPMLENREGTAVPSVEQAFFRTGRGVLWTAGILALLGCFWKAPSSSGMGAAFGLALWTEFLAILFLQPIIPWTGGRSIGREHLHWIPVLLLGLLLTPKGMLVYMSSIVFLELLRFGIAGTFGNRWNTGLDRHAKDKTSGDLGYGGSFRALPEPLPDGTTTQRILRYRNKDGSDRLEAMLRVEFSNEQEVVAVHLPFCPVFSSVPTITASLMEAGKVVVHEARLYGVRIDVRRTSEEQTLFHLSVVVEEFPSSLHAPSPADGNPPA